jgi:hypothetical protein
MTVLACQAGKDVYVEKPVSHNVVEGRRMVEAAWKYKRVVQAGTQRRSTPFVEEAIAQLRAGTVGKVGMARGWIHQKRVKIGHGKPGPIPAGVDYAMWQGPAPERPFYPNRFHYKRPSTTLRQTNCSLVCTATGSRCRPGSDVETARSHPLIPQISQTPEPLASTRSVQR